MEQIELQNSLGIIFFSFMTIGFGLFVCYKFGPEKSKNRTTGEQDFKRP